MVRFIHTADWQIGMKAAHVGAVAEQVRAARLESARRVVTVASEHNADFMIVAGDTFEDNAVERVLVQRIADILGSFSGPVFIIPGNHDPLVPGSVWDHASWQQHANLHLLAKAEPLEWNAVRLYPCPLFEKHSLKDPTHWIDARDSDRIAIGVAHGTVEGVSQSEVDYPIARVAASRAGLDYLALGHWHSVATYEQDNGDVRTAYSGTHETTKFGERNSGNVLLVEIAARGSAPNLTPIRTGGLLWLVIEREIAAAGDLSQLRAELEAMSDASRTLVDIRPRGLLSQEDEAELDRLDEIVQARFLFGRLDASGLLPRPDDDGWLADVPVGVMRAVAQRLQTLSNPAATEDRPDFAKPEVAARSLLELYRMIRETAS